MFVFATAFAALDIGVIVPFALDNPSRLVVTGRAPGQRLATPGAERVTIVVTFRKWESAAPAEVRLVFRKLKITQHLAPKSQ